MAQIKGWNASVEERLEQLQKMRIAIFEAQQQHGWNGKDHLNLVKAWFETSVAESLLLGDYTEPSGK